DTSSRNAFLSSFSGLNPNGDWTLFVADLSGGGEHVLESWSLEIEPVKLPDSLGFLSGCFPFALVLLAHRWVQWKRKTVASHWSVLFVAIYLSVAAVYSQQVNRPPIARDDNFQRSFGLAGKVSIGQLLSNDSDPDGDPLILVSVQNATPNGAQV